MTNITSSEGSKPKMFNTIYQARAEAQVKAKLYQEPVHILQIADTGYYTVALQTMQNGQPQIPTGYKLVETVQPG